MRALSLSLFVAALLVLACPARAQVKIDGVFFDWPAKAHLDVAPNQVEQTFANGDDTDPVRGSTNPNYFIDLDLDDVYAMDDADWVYFRIKLNAGANVQNILSDTTYHGGAAISLYISVDPGPADTTGLTWGWWGSGYDFLVQVFPPDTAIEAKAGYPQALWEHKQSGNGWDFVQADTIRGCLVAWNAGGNDVEVAVPKALLFSPKYLATFTMPDSIAVMAYAGENLSPWRADYASNPGVAGFRMKVKSPGAIAVDGVFFDWNASMQLDKAPAAVEETFANGDDTDPVRGSTTPSYFGDLDIEDVYAHTDEDFVYVRVKMAQGANVNNIATDTTYHGGAAIAIYLSVDPGVNDTTGLTWGSWASGYDFFVQAYPRDSVMEAMTFYPQGVWEHKQAGNGWDFELADIYRGAHVAWNASANDVEVAIPRAFLDHPRYLPSVTVKDSVMVMVYAGENLSPWRADYASNAGIRGFRLPLSALTAVANEPKELPRGYVLEQNYPNPFNPSTSIRYALPAAGPVRLRVFDLLGKEVATLVDAPQSAGWHTASFQASGLPSGVYFYRLESGSWVQTQKMVLVK
jgi:hypothetical protein